MKVFMLLELKPDVRYYYYYFYFNGNLIDTMKIRHSNQQKLDGT